MRKGLVHVCDKGHKDYMNRDSKEVAYSQIDLLTSDKYDIIWKDTRASGSQFITARMRSSFVFATMFPRFANGVAKHCVCFPLV